MIWIRNWILLYVYQYCSSLFTQNKKRLCATRSKYWDRKKLSDLNSYDFQKLINDFDKNHVQSSVSHGKNMIGTFIKYAIGENFTFKDFTRNVKTYSAKDSKDKNLKFLEVHKIEYLIHSLGDNQVITSKMILTAAYSGARYFEVTGLTKDNFDFQNNTISINNAWQTDDRAFKVTKTKSSNCVIDMPIEFMDIAKIGNSDRRILLRKQTVTLLLTLLPTIRLLDILNIKAIK